MANCPAGAEKLSANNQVARLPYTLFHCICSYHHSTFWQKNQENLSDKQTFLSTYSVSQYNTSHWIIKNSKDIFYLFLFSFTSFCDKTKLLVFEKKVIFYWSRIDFLKVFFVLSFFTGVMHNSNTFDLYQKKNFLGVSLVPKVGMQACILFLMINIYKWGMWADQLLSIFCMIVYFTLERLIVFEPNCGLYTSTYRVSHIEMI